MNLAELERYFARAATSGSGPLPELDRVFLGSERLSATDRLAIYNRGYFYRLLDALASVFSQTKRLLGDVRFRAPRPWLISHAIPPTTPPSNASGARSPSICAASGGRRLVVDLASLEWARLCALVAPNPASVATVKRIEPELVSSSAAALRALAALASSSIRARFRRLPTPTQRRTSAQPTLLQSPCGVAVWRTQHAVSPREPECAEWKALASAAGGATVQQICARLRQRVRARRRAQRIPGAVRAGLRESG